MPVRVQYHLMVVDRSSLARNLYQVLFSVQNKYRVVFAEEYESLFKKSPRFRPDLLIVNSNAVESGGELRFPCPTVLIASRNRLDLKEAMPSAPQFFLLEKPFYPYDLLSVVNRMVQDKREKPPRGRPPGRRKKVS